MRVASLIVIGLVALPVAANSVYKWKDANGQMHYTQTPPPNGATHAQSAPNLQPGVSIEVPKPATPVAEAKPPEAAAAAAETKEAKAKRCAESRDRVTFLEERTPHRLMLTQPDGSEARMTDEEYESSLAKARAAGKGC